MSVVKRKKSDIKSGGDVIDGKKKTYESLLNHVILPRFLPIEMPENALNEEKVLISRMTEAVLSCAGWIPDRIVRNFQRFKRTHGDLTGKTVSRQIDALEPGDTFAVLVKRQQCVFIVHMPVSERDADGIKMVQIGTFPSAATPKEIYKCSGDLQLTLPTFITEVEFSRMLRSEAFSQQLCRLYETAGHTKKNHVPVYVDAWLSAILCRKKNNRETEFKMPAVTKKMRDEVIGKGEKVRAGLLVEPWQRSPFYFTMKALLQLSLAIETDTIESKFVHKIVMLRFITRFCVEFENPAIFPTLNTDLLGQLLAKMARRIEKLGVLKAQYGADNHDEFYQQIVDEAKQSIGKIRARIDRQMVRLQESLECKAQLKPLRGLNFANDVKQTIPKIQEYLEKRKTFCENENAYAEPAQPRQLRRHTMNQRQFPQFENMEAMEQLEREIFLNDSENWLLYTLLFENDMRCTLLQKKYNEYIGWAEKIHSTSDPREQSIVMLIRLKFVAMMDRMVTQNFPLLLEHRTGIDTNIFNALLLPQAKEMQIAHELQLYFERRNEAYYPSLVEESEITSDAFAVRYGSYNLEMQEVRQRILEDADKQIQAKNAEFVMFRRKAQQLRDKASELRCIQPGIIDAAEIFHHRLVCDKCSTEHQLKQMKITQYQHPLPECIDRQNAIVFELRIPAEIAIYRDSLQSINKLGHDARIKLDMKENWIEKELLMPHKTARPTIVMLGSTVTNQLAEFTVEDRVDFNNLVVMNRSNCVLHEKGQEICASIKTEGIQKLFTLNVEAGSPYARLQWALISTNHTQNQILSKQSECPQNLSLSEFKEFGSLRADGHRLQLRKLYAMIETEALSFDQPSVLALVLESIWQMGPSSENSFVRESHEDFVNVDFAMAVLELLEKSVIHQEDNWVNPTKLLTIVFIVLRIFELNDFEHDDAHENILNRVVEIVHKIRAIALVWLRKIQGVLRETKEHSQDVEKSLRYSLVVVSITVAATFFANSNHTYFDKMFKRNPINGCSASRIWLMAVITLNNNIRLNSHVKAKAKTNLRMLTQLVRNTGIQIEAKIYDLIKAEPNDLFELIKTQWPQAGRGAFVSLNFCELCPQIAIIDVRFGNEIRRVSIDYVTGKFLVNACPVDLLPETIRNDATHKRVFGDYTFEVQPHGRNSFTTVHEFNGCYYDFGLWNNSTIVTERRPKNDGKESELIPVNIMKTEMAELLVENYSHWWKKQDAVIEFRPKDFSADNFAKESGIEYILNLNSSQLIEVKTQRCMLSIHSASYKNIQEYLQRLEQPKFIHVLMETPTMAKIELTRMNLKFRIDGTKPNKVGGLDVMSDEFSKMRISLQQNCRTLYRLNNGLLLECIPDDVVQTEASKLLILPHSKINLSGTSVDIDLTSELRSPPFHRYQVDETLRQLKPCNGNFSAWFYLAYLHAITSHGEAEPLTGMSGTERALQILQSSYVWSSAPYDIEATKTLQLISHLTPERGLVNQAQKIDWLTTIPNHCAQDSFKFIVQRLIEDSERLHELHFRKDQTRLKKLKNANFNVRDYSRCLPLNPNVRVNDTFIKYKPLETSRMAIAPVSQSRGVRLISHLYHERAFSVPGHLTLTGFLIDATNVDGPIHIDSVANYLNHQCRYVLSNMWISCFEVARKQKMNAEEMLLLLSLMVHEGGELDGALALQAIFNNPAAFQNINPPNVRTYSNPKETFDEKKISDILKSCPLNKKDVRSDPLRIAFENRIANDVYRITSYVKSKWPCEQVNLTTQFLSESIDLAEAETKIQQRITTWNDNKKLRDFVERIEGVLKQLRSANVQITGTKMKPEINEVNWCKYEIDIDMKMNRRINDWSAIEQANKVWQMEEDSERTVAEWCSIYNAAVLSTADKHLYDAGLFPRLVPSLVLPKLIDAKTHPDLKAIIGALALAISREQRKNRLEAGVVPVQDNHAYVNWKPCDYPEWLLFEIERDLTIRRIQIEIAKRMINPPDIGTKHSVMQLNMGEGKTAVIVPILASVLANGEHACQIIVLKSLFATNLNSLRQYLGGMLNRRIYIFPCRRDMPITDCITKLLPIYEECKRMKGVILTLPEYLLSFQLKIYESIQKGNTYAAGKFLAVHKWMNANIRNIMDESDAILQAKYQLIYTVGNQLPLDGGVNRYAVTQAILKRVPHHMNILYECFGDAMIEYDQKYIQNGQVYGAPRVTHRPDVFTPCRILDESVYDELSKLLIEDFINGMLEIQFPEMSETAKTLMKEFLSERRNSSVMFDKVKSEFTSVHMDILMILSGLLQFNLLKLVLTRRFRVNYGVKEKGARQMAIPFKAKDVATEMTEFGHPDVAICYTQLSYYYSGLTDEQLTRVFGVLKSNVNAADIYDKWIRTVPIELIQPSIEFYSGINLDDPTQRDELLFPLLRYNMYVIDYWLSLDVFPREAKTFEKKLTCTAWDLCSDHFEHRVTGFSGTNDTKNILPLPIAQNDLKELEQTNENVRRTLMRPENDNYEKLPANATGKMIIQKLVDIKVPVLLDAGALMLEFNNEQMAREWLKMAPALNSDAAVYFDSKDVLQTVDRNGKVVEFDCSVYRDNLSRCLVYVDDVHTRGTDLKFPYGWKACVTLSGDITRDKTVQACMRMRQLGNGHAISFWASHEADTRIRSLCNLGMFSKITSEQVINFICTNSDRFEMENIVHWAAAAHNYAKKLSGHKLYENSTDPTALGRLYDSTVDNELATLENLYGDKKEVKLSEITDWKFNELAKEFATQGLAVKDFIRQIERGVCDKIKDRDQICFRHALDEEQEKELEIEIEAEVKLERPPQMKPATPSFDKRLHTLFLNGLPNDMRHLKTTGVIRPIAQALADTHLYASYYRENNAWSLNVFVTQDFTSVLETDSEKCDNFLRPVWWIAGIRIEARIYWILLSSFECDRLLPTFRKSKNATLLMYRSRISKSHDNLLHESRLQVTGMINPLAIDLKIEVEIGVFGGSMFFKSNAEQNVFCNFIGSIPRPRSFELEQAFRNGIIKPNGFVPTANRKLSPVIAQCVGECKFNKNPAGMVIDLIIAHRQIMRKESHVASIVDGGIKVEIDSPDAVIADIKMEVVDIKEEPAVDPEIPDEADEEAMPDDHKENLQRNLRRNSKRKNNEPIVQPTLRRSKRFRSLV